METPWRRPPPKGYWNHPENVRLEFDSDHCSLSYGTALTALRDDLQQINGNDRRALDATLDQMTEFLKAQQCRRVLHFIQLRKGPADGLLQAAGGYAVNGQFDHQCVSG
jgi:hypothetical protein